MTGGREDGRTGGRESRRTAGRRDRAGGHGGEDRAGGREGQGTGGRVEGRTGRRDKMRDREDRGTGGRRDGRGGFASWGHVGREDERRLKSALLKCDFCFPSIIARAYTALHTAHCTTHHTAHCTLHYTTHTLGHLDPRQTWLLHCTSLHSTARCTHGPLTRL